MRKTTPYYWREKLHYIIDVKNTSYYEGREGGGAQSHFPPEIFPKSQSQLDFY